MTIEAIFAQLATDGAPGQDVHADAGLDDAVVRGEALPGTPVDFSHGDVDAHEPTPGSFEAFSAGVAAGGSQAYTEYRGDRAIRHMLGDRLARFTGAAVDADQGLIITPGTQGALFLAMASTITRGDAIAIVRPDYFANRKIAEFLEARPVPVTLRYLQSPAGTAGLDLGELEQAFLAGARAVLLSNPNNPTGVVYSAAEIDAVAALATRYGATVVVDQLYSRLLYRDTTYTHLRAGKIDPDLVVTIIGPSKTESLSGYRLGVAFGSPRIISRMEKLQAIVSLRAAGYSQAVLRTWFDEPAGWMDERIRRHQAIRDGLLAAFRAIDGAAVRTPEAGSYLFVKLPPLTVSHRQFIKLLRSQANVTVTVGTQFSPDTGDSVRLNFSQSPAAALDAAARMATMMERYRP